MKQKLSPQTKAKRQEYMRTYMKAYYLLNGEKMRRYNRERKRLKKCLPAITVTITPELMAKIDRVTDNRSRLVRRLLEEHLRDVPLPDFFFVEEPSEERTPVEVELDCYV